MPGTKYYAALYGGYRRMSPSKTKNYAASFKTPLTQEDTTSNKNSRGFPGIVYPKSIKADSMASICTKDQICQRIEEFWKDHWFCEIFFSEPIPAKLARQLGAFMLTQAMESRPEIGFDSYDRFFLSQDTLPRGGFGNPTLQLDSVF